LIFFHPLDENAHGLYLHCHEHAPCDHHWTPLKYTKTQLEKQKEFLQRVYQRAATRITQTLSNEQVTLKHKNLHKMIDRGLVSAPLVIELHRQIMDYYERLHKQELEGVIAKWKIAALEGKISKEKLQ
jgi:hypothetical protein